MKLFVRLCGMLPSFFKDFAKSVFLCRVEVVFTFLLLINVILLFLCSNYCRVSKLVHGDAARRHFLNLNAVTSVIDSISQKLMKFILHGNIYRCTDGPPYCIDSVEKTISISHFIPTRVTLPHDTDDRQPSLQRRCALQLRKIAKKKRRICRIFIKFIYLTICAI